MNAKAITVQTSKYALRKSSRLGSAKAVLPARQLCGSFEQKARRKKASETNLPTQNSSPSEPATVVEAKIDVGLGNRLFIRGQGDGLSWEKGLPLNCIDPTTWVWSKSPAKEQMIFKLLLNDQVWAKGVDVVVEPGQRIQLAPGF